MEIDWAALRAAAIETMRRAYTPVSDFPVGVAGPAAHQVGQDRAGAELPLRRARVAVMLREGFEFVGVGVLGVLAQDFGAGGHGMLLG